jgi:hypothetical protein
MSKATTIDTLLGRRAEERERAAAEVKAAQDDYRDLVRKAARDALTGDDAKRLEQVIDLLNVADEQVASDVALVRRHLADAAIGPKAGDLAEEAAVKRQVAESFEEATGRLADEAAEQARRETVAGRADEGAKLNEAADDLDRQQAAAVAAARRLAADLRGPSWKVLGLDDPAPRLQAAQEDLERRRRLRGITFDHPQRETRHVEAASGDYVTAFSAGHIMDVATGHVDGTDGMRLQLSNLLEEIDLVPLKGQSVGWLDVFVEQLRRARPGQRPILIVARPVSVLGVDKLRPDEAVDRIRRHQLNPDRTTFFPHPSLPLADFRRVVAEPKPDAKQAAVDRFMVGGAA